MTKFKVGDRVRFVRRRDPDEDDPIDLGATGTVELIDRWYLVRLDKLSPQLTQLDDDPTYGFWEEELELLEDRDFD